ncbi:hypothetical protein [Gracilimonas sp.]|uniref:hypothetical protein n=1 Tax=Gracilimonas sp. TaxID=1974203 RepID=UPI0028724F41|nr:hypothetical protein [Gracilimonas sp.]
MSQGLTSIDSFLNYCAYHWNKKNPSDLLVDNFSNKVSLETKINDWIPKISGGNKIEKRVKQWSDFKKLKQFRDEEAVHPKGISGGIEFEKIAELLNSFRYGIALLLGNIHMVVGKKIPSIIINAYYMPDVIVEKDNTSVA